MKSSSSFTLVELLIVIGILAILTAAVVIILNPAELLKQGRDSQRMQDLTAVDKALSLLTTQTPDISLGTASSVYISIPDTSATCANLGLPSLPSGYTYSCVTAANLRNTTGTGWIPVNFQTTTISSLPALPIDPVNATTTGLYYTYAPGGSYELTALIESDKYLDKTINDGGMLTGVLQKGSHIDLTPATRDKGLVSYWTFDEGSGSNAYDHSGNNNTGVLTTGPVWQTASNCKKGNCVSLDGADDFIEFSNANLLNTGTFSLMGWVNLQVDAGGNYHAVMQIMDVATSQGYQIYISELPQMCIYATTNLCTGLAPAFNTWNFIAVVVDRTNFRAYVNNLSFQGTRTAIVPVQTIAYKNIGRFATSGLLRGKIDEFRFYNRPLSEAEIQAIYNTTK